jgi:quercetin dioxygenase-like cupin family protein
MQRIARWTITAVSVLTLAGCSDSTRPQALSTTDPTRPTTEPPEFTVASGVVNTQIARGNFGPVHIQSESRSDQFGLFNIDLETQDNTDVEVRDQVYSPGGYSGWHTHLGPVLVVVKSGALTAYEASGENCLRTVHAAGTAFVEGTTVHNVRNEGTVDAEVGVFFFMPAGAPRRIDAGAPANCPA